MGNSESKLEGSTIGLHIISCKEPGIHAGIEEYFDYITHINGKRMSGDLFEIKYTGKQVNLIIYSSKTLNLRNVSVIPTANGLGLECRYCDFEFAHERVWHVLDVFENSPAEVAGFQSESDYIIGSTQVALKAKDDLSLLLQNLQGSPVDLIVYNAERDDTRQVFVIPDASWGGKGILGCDIGFGFRHRIALKRGEISPPIMTRTVSSLSNTQQRHDHSHHSHENCSHDHHDHQSKNSDREGHAHSHKHINDNHVESKHLLDGKNEGSQNWEGNNGWNQIQDARGEVVAQSPGIIISAVANASSDDKHSHNNDKLVLNAITKNRDANPEFQKDFESIISNHAKRAGPSTADDFAADVKLDTQNDRALPHFPTIETLTRKASRPSLIVPIVVKELEIDNGLSSKSWSANSL